jgi:hypothetical protein
VVRPNPDQQVPTALQSSQTTDPAASPAVRPNPDQQIATAQTRSTQSGNTASPVRPNPDQQASLAAAAAASSTPHSGVTSPPIIVRVSAPTGFDWADAGIGAGSGIGLSMLALGGALAFSQVRGRAATRPTTTTN